MNLLMSFLSMQDPYDEGSQVPGPVLQVINKKNFQEMMIFFGASSKERFLNLKREISRRNPECSVQGISMPVDCSGDYEEMMPVMKKQIKQFSSQLAEKNLHIALNSGSTDINACWL